jgi:hypothetical protein
MLKILEVTGGRGERAEQILCGSVLPKRLPHTVGENDHDKFR